MSGPDSTKALLFRQSWTKPEIVRAYERTRGPFRGCASRIVRSALGKHLQASDRILEVGSGLGELLDLAPELEGRLVQSEQSAAMAKENRWLHPDSRMVVADAHALPFRDGKFDAVVGFSSFDTFGDLPTAVKETRRVLAPRGKFMHFLDMIACENPLMHKLACEGRIGFPSFETAPDGKRVHTGFLAVSQEEAERVAGEIGELAFRDLFSAYASNPIDMYWLISRQDMRLLAVMDAMLKVVGARGEVIPHTGFFTDNLTSALRESGFSVRTYKVYDEEIVEHSVELESLGKLPLHNSYLNDVGVLMSRIEGGLGFGKARVKLGIQVISAERTD